MKILLLCSLYFISLYAEVTPLIFVGNAQNSNKINWKTIESESFQIIYPDNLQESAQRAMNALELTHKYSDNDLMVTNEKISIILRPGQTQSNGYVTLAPRRSEWFITPYFDTDLGSGNWIDLLAIHEYRHVTQMEAIFEGFSKALYYLLGESGRGLGGVWNTPNWFMEGDAVFMETYLTRYGRGRLPEFEMQMKALFLEYEEFPVQKMLLRSYNEFIPNHYAFGFYLVSYLREHYSNRVMREIVNKMTSSGYNPFSFYNAIEEVTRASFQEIYGKMRNYFLQQWRERAKSIPTSNREELLASQEGFENYRFLWPYKNKLVAYKEGFSSPGEIVFIQDRKEEPLKTIGMISSSGPKLCSNYLLWSEYTPHHRWGLKSFSEIVLYNLKSKERKKITSRTRYFSANFSSDCEKIVAIENTEKLQNFVVILNREGKILQREEIPNQALYYHVDFGLDAKSIIAAKKENKKGKVSLVQFSLESKKENELIKPDFYVIGNPEVDGNDIYFRWSMSGVDSIYRFNLKTKNYQQVISSTFGAFNPTVDENYIYYSEYTARGYRPVKSSKRAFSRTAKRNEASIGWDEKMAKRSSQISVKDVSFEQKTKKYKEKDYSFWSGAFNPHSWLVIPTPASVDLALVSSNIMQDLYLTAGYSYSNVEGTGGAFAGASFAKYYPIFDFSISEKRRASQTPGTVADEEIYQHWYELELETGVSFPINFSSGGYERNIFLRPFYGVTRVEDRPYNTSNQLDDETLQYFGSSFAVSVGRRMSFLDYYPRWGFSSELTLKKGRVASDNSIGSNFFSSENYFYFPGFFNHHSFYTNASFSYQRDLSYQFSSEFIFGRGYNNYYFDHINKYSVNYTLPLLTPDWILGDYFYLRRLGINLFYDYTNGELDTGFSQNFRSFGSELLINSSFFMNALLTIDWGVRYSHAQDDHSDKWELFLMTSF